ncbi:MAG: DUF2812 domain-containing protein [Ruminiclostridium sp.]
MKNIKKIMCSGLAFGDKEDMEMLNQYALEGWIFREFKGIFYILHKEEPKDLIFSYDFCSIKIENESEYYDLFKSAGWQPVRCKDKTIHFFCAKSGTVPVHTDNSIQANQFKDITKWTLIAFIISVVTFIVSLQFNNLIGIYGIVQTVVLLLSASIMGGSGMCFIGCFLRTKNRRLFFNISIKNNIILLGVFTLIFLILHFLPMEMKPLDTIFSILTGLSIGGIISTLINLFFKYPLYRDGKAK